MRIVNKILANIAYWIVDNITEDKHISILEKFIALDATTSFYYCKNYCTERFVLGEKIISEHLIFNIYYISLIIGRNYSKCDNHNKLFLRTEQNNTFRINDLDITKHHIDISKINSFSIVVVGETEDSIYMNLVCGETNSIIVKNTHMNEFKKDDIVFLYGDWDNNLLDYPVLIKRISVVEITPTPYSCYLLHLKDFQKTTLGIA